MVSMQFPSNISDRKIEFKEFFIFIVIPTFLYAGFVTNFTFNFFAPYNTWLAYNEYFLSIINGRLDVPVNAIMREGQYIDGKAYMYYGLLPILPRIFLHPFVNLSEVPVSAFSVWFFSVIGVAYLQISILLHFKKYVHTQKFYNTVLLVCVSILVWFCSGNFIILQDASLYHEPYAASMCLVNLYVGLLLKNDFKLQSGGQAALYALLAGLCVQARMPTALSLYAVTSFLILNSSFSYVKDINGKVTIVKWCKTLISNYWLSILVMFVLGLSILVLNYMKFDGFFRFTGVPGHYGFFLAGEGYTERYCNLVPHTEWSWLFRIIPNSIVFMIGGWGLHDYLMNVFQTGFVRKAPPLIPFALLWFAPFVIFITVTFLAIRKKLDKSNFILIILLSVSVGGLFQLSYRTINYRYFTELWPLLLISIVVLSHHFFKGAFTFNNKKAILLGFITILTLGYNVKTSFVKDTQNWVGDPKAKYYEELLKNMNEEKIKQIRQNFLDGKEEGCKKLKLSMEEN